MLRQHQLRVTLVPLPSDIDPKTLAALQAANAKKSGAEFFARLFPKSDNDPQSILQKISNEMQQDTLENIVPYLKLVK